MNHTPPALAARAVSALSCPVRRVFRDARIVFVLCVSLLMLAGPVVHCPAERPAVERVATEPDAVAEPEAAGPASSERARQLDDQDQELRKQRQLLAGFSMLGLICLVFLFLILMVVIWGRRLRVDTAAPLPDQHSGDPLWYLRQKHAPGGDPRDEGAAS